MFIATDVTDYDVSFTCKSVVKYVIIYKYVSSYQRMNQMGYKVCKLYMRS